MPIWHGWSSYYLMWILAAVLILIGGTIMALIDGHTVRRMLVGIIVFGAVALGSRLLYVAEQNLFPNDDIIPLELRAAGHGFRIPGGIILAALVLPLACRAFQLEWKRYADRLVLLLPVLLGCIRIGCYLNGCCFGALTAHDSVLSARFPPGSVAYFYQLNEGLISPGAAQSLAVHPLQLYFACAAALILVILILQRRYLALPPGSSALAFIALFFSSSLILEGLRGSRLHLNEYLLSIVVGAVFVLAVALGVATTPAARK